jgi:hypothetical protein
VVEVVGAQRDRLERVRTFVVPRQDDHLGIGRLRQQLLQGRQALRRAVRIGRQAEVHRRHRRLVAPHLRQRGLAVAGEQDFVAIEAPAQLLLQSQIVFDDQQLLLCHVRLRG